MAAPSRVEEPIPTTSPAHPADFLRFWAGESVSMFGTQITLLALPLTAVLVLNATPQQLGIVRFVEALPYILCTLPFGAWSDRRRRRPVLIVANAARAVLVGLVPLLALLHLLQLSLLAIIAFSVVVFTVLFDVTWPAYVQTLVKPERLVDANGRMMTSSSASEVAGPGLAGALVQALSAPLALLADAFSYVAALVTLLAIRTVEPPVRPSGQANLLREIREGFQVMLTTPLLRAITFMSGLWNLLFGIADTTFLLYAVRELGMQPGTLGAVYAVSAVGGLVGTAISTRLGRRGTFGPILGIAFTFGCVPWLLLPIISGSPALEVGGFTLAYFLVRVGLGLWSVLTLTLRQAITPPRLMGRVAASIRLVSYGLGALGPLLAGILGTALGLRPTLWLAAVGFLVNLTLVLLTTPLPRLRALPRPATEE